MLELLSNHDSLWLGAEELSSHKRQRMKEKEKIVVLSPFYKTVATLTNYICGKEKSSP